MQLRRNGWTFEHGTGWLDPSAQKESDPNLRFNFAHPENIIDYKREIWAEFCDSNGIR